LEDLLNIDEYIKLVIGLIILVDPLGAIPVFLALTKGELAAHRHKIILVSMIAFVITLIVFLFAGSFLFSHFGLSIDAFRVGGGLLLLKIAYDMMQDTHSGERSSSESVSPVHIALVPLAIPLFAGPGTITMTLISGSGHLSIDHKILVGLVILSVAILTSVILLFASRLEKLIGHTGMSIINQLMAIIVLVIGVEFILDGVAAHFGLEILGGHS
jgi:multiple antibiotic resistance protein